MTEHVGDEPVAAIKAALHGYIEGMAADNQRLRFEVNRLEVERDAAVGIARDRLKDFRIACRQRDCSRDLLRELVPFLAKHNYSTSRIEEELVSCEQEESNGLPPT